MASYRPFCSALEGLSDFRDYIQALNETTEFQIRYLRACSVEICTAIYGTGNPDISGIGVRLPFEFMMTVLTRRT